MEASDQVLAVDEGRAGASRRRFLGRAAGTAAVSIGVIGASAGRQVYIPAQRLNLTAYVT
jgi:hypothetical protein